MLYHLAAINDIERAAGEWKRLSHICLTGYDSPLRRLLQRVNRAVDSHYSYRMFSQFLFYDSGGTGYAQKPTRPAPLSGSDLRHQVRDDFGPPQVFGTKEIFGVCRSAEQLNVLLKDFVHWSVPSFERKDKWLSPGQKGSSI